MQKSLAQEKATPMPERTPHIAIVPCPGMGHLIPVVEFAKTLTHRHKFSVTIFIPCTSPPSAAIKTIAAPVTHVFLPPVSFTDRQNPNDRAETLLTLAVARSVPDLRHEMEKLAVKATALVVDLFSTDAFELAEEFGIPAYMFFPSTAMCLSLCLYLPKLDAAVKGAYQDLTEPVKIPGCFPVFGSDLLDPVQDRENEAYRCFMYHVKRFKNVEGIIVNSFINIETGAIQALQGGHDEYGGIIPPIYPVGPLIKKDDPNKQCGSDPVSCLQWLDEQPAGSVLYVCLGSGGTLSHGQMCELAAGLETSEQRFLWVVRCPANDGSANDFYLKDCESDPLNSLPPGFLARIKNRGFLVPSWAPQTEILAHRSVGGFLSHCGWNSTLESVVRGVPIIAWPLHAEQKMNAVVLVSELRVALRGKKGGEWVGREEIAAVVKELMEGEEGKKVRNRMRQLMEAAAMVSGVDGSSSQSLSELARDLVSRMTKEQQT